MENNDSYAPSFALWQRCCDAQILTMPHGRKALDARKGAAKRCEAWTPSITYNPYAPVLRFSRLAIKQNPEHMSHYYL